MPEIWNIVRDYDSKNLSMGGVEEDNSRHVERRLVGGRHRVAEGPDVARVDTRRADLYRTNMTDEVGALVSH